MSGVATVNPSTAPVEADVFNTNELLQQILAELRGCRLALTQIAGPNAQPADFDPSRNPDLFKPFV